MTSTIAQLFIVAVVSVGLTAVLIDSVLDRRSKPVPRDDMVRAGGSGPPDSRTAATRASGSVAWMRPGGGGF